MPETADTLKTKLAKHIVDRVKHPNVPFTLDGEILLGEVRDEAGAVLGWVTITPENLANILDMRDNPSKRPVEHQGKSKGEFETLTGHKKYLDRWRGEGVTV